MTSTIAVSLTLCAAAWGQSGADWPVWGHDLGGQRFSPLADINRSNVAGLKVAWTYHTGDAYQPKGGRPTLLEATPIFVDGTLYLATPLGKVIALDPATGRERWTYDAKVPKDAGFGDFANRGVSTWQSAGGKRRIFVATLDARLIALDAATGERCADFGDQGAVDLRKGLRIPVRGYSDYEETSPATVVGNTVIVGSGIADNGSVRQPSGEVRGYDAVTGKLKWTWDPLPAGAQYGAGNAWTVMAADAARGLVFVPTGSASPDYYGGERTGDNRNADSVTALRADTGEVVWSFQTVHHNLWDYDVASPPVLFDVHRGGRTIPAIGVGSKTGHFFILDRTNGKPVFGVEERPVPASDVPGETAWPTQPVPLLPKALAPQTVDVNGIVGSEADRKWCRDEIAGLRSEGIFTPPSVRGSLIIPGNVGGMSWSGAAYDGTHQLVVIPTNNLAAEVKLVPRDSFNKEREAAGRDLTGQWEFAPQSGTPYGMARRLLRAPGGWPCTPPPWGKLVAIDANTGAVKWSVPAGSMPALGSAGAPPPDYGSLVLGGPIVTAGGLVFMAGTLDAAIRGYDVETGKVLWKGELPAAARAMPMTYRGPDGKQYLVISAGGWGLGAPGDSVVAFTLGN